MTRGIIKFLFMGMIVAPLAILIGGGRLELAISVGVGFVFWIIVVYIITKPIEVIVKNKDNIKNAIKNNPINKNQQSLHTKTSQKQTTTEIDKNIHITPEEEEEIYAKVSREFSENKKEGMWTKALIQSDGDENKAKIGYMKLRVEQLINNLLELKLEQQNEVLRKHEEALLSEQLDKPNLTTIEKLKLLIQQSKKNKIKGKELIPTEYIEFLAKKFNPKVHRTNSYIHMFKELNKLVENSKSNKIKGHELIPTEYIEQIVSEFESLFG